MVGCGGSRRPRRRRDLPPATLLPGRRVGGLRIKVSARRFHRHECDGEYHAIGGRREDPPRRRLRRAPTFAPLFPTTAAWLQENSGDERLLPPRGLPRRRRRSDGAPRLRRDRAALRQHGPPVRQGSGVVLRADRLDVRASATSLASEQNGPMGLLAHGSQSAEAWTRLPANIRCCYDSSGTLQVSLLAVSRSRRRSRRARSTRRRRYGSAGAKRRRNVDGSERGGNLNTCGDKGEDVYIRYSRPDVHDPDDPRLRRGARGG